MVLVSVNVRENEKEKEKRKRKEHPLHNNGKRSGSGCGHDAAVAADMRQHPVADKGHSVGTWTAYSQHP